MQINITSVSNLTGSKLALFVFKRSPEILKVLSQETWVAGIDKMSHATLDINANLLIIISFRHNLKTFNLDSFPRVKLAKYDFVKFKSFKKFFK